jgi:amino acid transporter
MLSAPWNDANIPLGIVFVCLGFLPMFTVYAMLSTLMPRAGGDYVWQSRAFGGIVGYILTFTPIVVSAWFYTASNLYITPMITAPTFIALGAIFNAPGLINVATFLSSTNGMFLLYVIYIIYASLLLSLGMKAYARVQRYSFYIGMLGVASWAIMLLVTTQTNFAGAFNDFMANTLGWGGGQAYQQILDMAKAGGFAAVPLAQTSALSSFLIGPVLAYTFMALAWTGTLVGEIGGLSQFKNSMRIYWGGNFVCLIMCALFMWLLIGRVGNEFFTSANFLIFSGGASELPVAPYYSIFLMSLTKSPLLWLWIAIGMNAWFWIWPVNGFVGSTRVMFAMSYDRMLPSALAKVYGRMAVPLWAIGACFLGSLIFGYLYFYTAFVKLTLDVILVLLVCFGASTLAGALLPYLKVTKRLYADSPISKYKVGNIPAITIVGALGLIYIIACLYLYISDGRYGVNSLLSALFILGMVVLSAAIYLVYKWYRRREGINTDLTYKEIPTD